MKLYFSGGLNEQQQPYLHEAAKGSYNFDLSQDRNALIPRAAFDLKGTAPNAGEIRGILQLIKRDDSTTTLIQAENVLYSWNGASAFTNVGSPNAASKLRGTYWSLDDYLVVTDIQKLTPVSRWNGTTFTTQTTGLGTSLYARYAIVRDGRVWLFNVRTATDTPHLMVASAFEAPTSYDTTQRAETGTFATGLEAFYMLTPDLRPINGVAETLAGDLIISTEGGALFKLTGSSADDYKFVSFFPRSNAVGTETLASMGNDIIYMRQGGSIDLLAATQNYGDIAADDLSRYLRDTTAGLDDAIVVYDQTKQKVLFFVDDKVLVLFKDILYVGSLVGDVGERAKSSPWTVYKTQDAGNFNTEAAKFCRVPGSTEYSVFFGADDGRIFDLNGIGTSGDAGSADIITVRRSRYLSAADGANFMNGINRGVLRYRRLNQMAFNLNIEWADELAESDASLLLKGDVNGGVAFYGSAAYYSGAAYYNTLGEAIGKISHINFSFAGRGPGGVLTCSTTSTKPYQVEVVELE